jgi:hypothetical protein
MLSGKAANTNFIVFGLTRSALEPMIYRTPGELSTGTTYRAVNRKDLSKVEIKRFDLYLRKMGRTRSSFV